MAQARTPPKVVRTLAKGQITIPNVFREALGIDTETLLNVTMVDDHLEIAPLRQGDDLRRYTEADIAGFLKEDKLDVETAEKVRGLVGSGDL